MTSNDLDSLGLILDIAGVLILFKFGFPQPDFEESVGLSVEDNTPVTTNNGRKITAKKYAEEVRRKKRIYRHMSLLALTLILVGFILQLISSLQK